MIRVTERWKKLHPGASIGVLAMRGVSNPETCPALDRRKEELEAGLRARYAGWDRAALKRLPVLGAYAAYYGRFEKTYHVLAQLESVALKGKPVPRVAALIEAMFMAELSSLLLTAGHDLDSVRGLPVVDAATGAEAYTTLAGREQALKPDDMFIRDDHGVMSSILYGPDFRTRILPQTTRALLTVYAPPGIEPPAVADHLAGLRENLLLISPEGQVEYSGVQCADGSVLAPP
jgi:DNA/RNA-binding domain of Phe-tRNA-synthetase-like protein